MARDRPEFDVEMAEGLANLFESQDWLQFAKLVQGMRTKFRANLVTFSLNGSVEEIGKQHIRWSAAVSGIDDLMMQMNELVGELKRREKEKIRDARPGSHNDDNNK